MPYPALPALPRPACPVTGCPPNIPFLPYHHSSGLYMMNLVQQARYLSSNSGGSWFNSAFSYQASAWHMQLRERIISWQLTTGGRLHIWCCVSGSTLPA